MTFYDEMRALVLRHGAINNPYLDRFKTAALNDEEFRRFALEFYNFARFFPKILVAQLVNTEDEAIANELTTVLYSELGDGRPKNRHELLYRDFLRSVGIDVHDALSRPMLPSTRAYIEGMEQLYSSGNHAMALGASFGAGEHGDHDVGPPASRPDGPTVHPLPAHGHDLFHVPPSARSKP